MRRGHCVAVVLALCALGGCTNEPLCRYWTDEPIGRNLSDPSELPMLPYNPYWVTKNPPGSPATPTSQDACAGEPGHPATISN
jgi:hypothetical protein